MRKYVLLVSIIEPRTRLHGGEPITTHGRPRLSVQLLVRTDISDYRIEEDEIVPNVIVVSPSAPATRAWDDLIEPDGEGHSVAL